MANREELTQALRAALEADDQELALHLSKSLQGVTDVATGEKPSKSDLLEGLNVGAATAAQGIAQGATLGFSDELAAGLRAGLEKYISPAIYAVSRKIQPFEGQEDKTLGELYGEFQQFYPGTLGERYEEALESQRGAIERAKMVNPVGAGLAELAGGLATGGPAMAASVAGRGIGAGLLRAGGTGTGLGAGAGYGYSEADPLAALARGAPQEEVLPEAGEAGVDVATGAAVGKIFGVAVPGAAAAARAVTRMVSRPFTRGAQLTETGRRQVQKALTEDLERGGISLKEAQQELAQTPGMVAADLGPAMQGLAERVAQSPTGGGRELQRQLKQRATEQYERVMPAVSRALGHGGDRSNFASLSERLLNDARTQADALYGQAYASDIRITPELDQILHKTPLGRLAIRKANALAGMLQRPQPAIGKAGTTVNTEALDHVIQSMDDHVNQLFKAGQGKMGRAAKELRNKFKEQVYDQNPAFREARRAWAGYAESDEALDAGLRIFRDDADVTANILRDMSEGERTYFRVGVLRAVERKLGAKADTADITKGLTDRPNVRAALRAAFGDEAAFNDFVQRMAQEQRMFQTFQQATGNSATARRLMQQSENQGIIGDVVARGGQYAAGSPFLLPGILRDVSRYVGGRSPALANEMMSQQAPMLMTRQLQDITTPHTVGGLLGVGVPESAARLTGGVIAGGLLTP